MSETGNQSEAAAGSGDHPARLTWSLCVVTLDRPKILEFCVLCALAQTRPPTEIVIVDASDAWRDHHALIQALTAPAGVPLTYLPATRRSTSAQRNLGIRAATADILVMIDDDSFMHPDCAEKILAVYEADGDETIAAVEASMTLRKPELVADQVVASQIEERNMQEATRQSSWLKRFIYREILMMSVEGNFIAYDGPLWKRWEHLPLPPKTQPNTFIGGCTLTVRRKVAVAELFDGGLLSYSPGEDRDASYRFLRHGRNLLADDAFLYHAETPVSRMKRFELTALTILNISYFARKNTRKPLRDLPAIVLLWLRRCLAEFLKDGLKGRFTFPQFRGALYAGLWLPGLLLQSRETVQAWYERRQAMLLWGTPVPRPGPGAQPPDAGSAAT
ncbi:MAG: glycosyltransferase [Tabrizicola sp.]|nr:glycosyltransferase [Tabrizicola sp.]